MATEQIVRRPNGRTSRVDEILQPWLKRRDDARQDRRRYEVTWQMCQFFAAGIQWLQIDVRNGRVLDDSFDKKKRLRDVVDVLSQYNGTAIGKLAQGDLRPQLLAQYHSDEAAKMYTEQLNDALAFAWDEECKGDKRLLAVLRSLVELGTGAIRCRYDRSKGRLIADQVPHVNGKPLLDPMERAQHMHQQYVSGGAVDLRPLREGQIGWEKLSAWNLLPPPGVEDPCDFPWELIVRPVSLSELRMVYGDKARDVKADKLEDMGMLAHSYTAARFSSQGNATSPSTVTELHDHALVYTGYLRPDNEHANGQQVIFTHDGHLLDEIEQLPYQREPWGPRSGITYFRWSVLEGRFWGRSFMEPGIGPQRIRNKRESQINEIIDRSLPKIFMEEGSINPDQLTGRPMEIVFVKTNSQLPKPDPGVGPGAWMQQSVDQADVDIEKALGLHSVTQGQTPTGASPYSALALVSENDAVKLDPIAQDFKLGIADVVRDTIEAMDGWPSDKQLMVAGEGDELRVAAFNSKEAIPPAYLVRPAKGGTLPRSQAAEIQKITDIFNAAETSGAAAQDSGAWLDWYKRSLDAGKAQDLPRMDATAQQRHKAALENVTMIHTGQVLPVAPYDDPQIHVAEHDQELMDLSQAAELGDEHAVRVIPVIEQHKQQHLLAAQQAAAAGGGQGAGPQGPQPQGAPQQPQIPPRLP